MKSFKEIISKVEELSESEYTTWGSGQRSAHSDYGVHRIENQDELGRINAFLNAFTKREFLDPKAAIAELRHKFNTMTLDFDWNNTSSFDGGSVELPVTRFGGTFGKSLTTPHDEFETTDGISEFNNGVGFALNISVDQPDGGLYTIDAKMMPVMEQAVTEDTEEVIEEGLDHDGRELHLYATNHGDLHRQRIKPIQKNLRNKMASGKYDHDKAHKAWHYAAKDASDRYHKEHGHRFSKDTVHAVAGKMRDDFHRDAKDGDHDDLLHKKYKGHKVT